MTARNLGTIAAAISRHTRGEVPFGEILQAIADANAEINSKYDWPWTRAEGKIAVHPNYNVGTINVADNSTNVDGVNTVWDVGWQYKTLLLGATTYPIAAINSPTNLTLLNPVNQGQDFFDSAYTIFQEFYPLPDDCEFGSIIMLGNPLASTFRYRVRYVPVYTLERQSYMPGFFTNLVGGFSDGGFDSGTRRNLIKLTPPPGPAGDLTMIYRRRPPDLTAIGDVTMLPESFDRVIELMAEYLVRLNQPTPMPGWMEKKVEAYQLLQAMRRKMATTLYDNTSNAGYQTYPSVENLSYFADGVYIGPTTGSL